MRVAVIGLGRIGFEFSQDSRRVQPASHVACYNSLPDVDAIAICDKDDSKLAPALATIDKDKKAYSNFYQMLTEFQPEIVSICTPTTTHKEIASAVAKCSSVEKIFLEKPIAQSLKEADEIINACAKNNVALNVNYVRRWSRIYNMAKDAIVSQDIIALHGTHPGPILRTGTHMIDLFNWFTAFQLSKADLANANATAFSSSLSPYMKGTDDLNINGIINYGETQAWLIGQQVPYLLFDLSVICKNRRIQILNNGEELTVHKTFPSTRYEKIEELKHVSTIRHVDEESILFLALEEIVNTRIVTCSGQTARNALLVALALHFSATHDDKTVKLTDVPYDYSVRSY